MEYFGGSFLRGRGDGLSSEVGLGEVGETSKGDVEVASHQQG